MSVVYMMDIKQEQILKLLLKNKTLHNTDVYINRYKYNIMIIVDGLYLLITAQE